MSRLETKCKPEKKYWWVRRPQEEGAERKEDPGKSKKTGSTKSPPTRGMSRLNTGGNEGRKGEKESDRTEKKQKQLKNWRAQFYEGA